MGNLIAFDGIDASGKTTQAKILEKRLRESGREILYLSFPAYESESSSLVKLYLNGALGARPDEVNAYAASSFFAADRYISFSTGWKEFYGRPGSLIIANRYTTANAVHQLSKLPKNEWDGFLDWLYDFEFEKLKLPKPDLTVFFDMHFDVALKLVEERAKKTSAKKDIHEMDQQYLKRCCEAGKYAAEYLGWESIVCYRESESGVLSPKSESEISEDLFELTRYI
ncbi:MAG: deoxynucleoside kinase [Oscillospiraceae bacterium]|nr:deoxynucleoside kinase [Oscillospiraceae bacterium]